MFICCCNSIHCIIVCCCYCKSIPLSCSSTKTTLWADSNLCNAQWHRAKWRTPMYHRRKQSKYLEKLRAAACRGSSDEMRDWTRQHSDHSLSSVAFIGHALVTCSYEISMIWLLTFRTTLCGECEKSEVAGLNSKCLKYRSLNSKVLNWKRERGRGGRGRGRESARLGIFW